MVAELRCRCHEAGSLCRRCFRGLRIFLKTAIQQQPRTRESVLRQADQGEGAYNLREVQTIIADSVEDQILKLVDYPKQVLTQRSHRCVGRWVETQPLESLEGVSMRRAGQLKRFVSLAQKVEGRACNGPAGGIWRGPGRKKTARLCCVCAGCRYVAMLTVSACKKRFPSISRPELGCPSRARAA